MRRRIEEVFDEILIPQPPDHLRPAHAAPLPVDHADLAETALRRLAQVLPEGGEDILGAEGMEVERVLYGKVVQGKWR